MGSVPGVQGWEKPTLGKPGAASCCTTARHAEQREGIPWGQQQDPQGHAGTGTTELALCSQESRHAYLCTASFGLGAHTALLWPLSESREDTFRAVIDGS